MVSGDQFPTTMPCTSPNPPGFYEHGLLVQSPQRTLRRGGFSDGGFPGNLQARLHFVWGVGPSKNLQLPCSTCSLTWLDDILAEDGRFPFSG